jgi:hypothetical protein
MADARDTPQEALLLLERSGWIIGYLDALSLIGPRGETPHDIAIGST